MVATRLARAPPSRFAAAIDFEQLETRSDFTVRQMGGGTSVE
jgi:hypothetical protein